MLVVDWGIRKRLFCMDFGKTSFCLFNFDFLDVILIDHKFLNKMNR